MQFICCVYLYILKYYFSLQARLCDMYKSLSNSICTQDCNNSTVAVRSLCPQTWKSNEASENLKPLNGRDSDWAQQFVCVKTIRRTLFESIHLKFDNNSHSLLCVTLLTVEIHLINANLSLSYRVKGIKISMEMQSMNNGNLGWEIQRRAIWSSTCQGNCILLPYLFLSP